MVEHTFDEKAILDRNLALEAVRVTEAAALSASRLIGRGDEKAADQAAVDSMRHACLLYTSPSPRDSCASRMPSSA